MKIGLIGAGRLGICLALLIEKAGYEVLASDNRIDYVTNLKKGIIDTAEPEVQQYLSNAKNIEFTTDNLRVISECDLIFTLVATPSLADGSYDVSAVWKVINDFKDIPILLDEKSLVIGCTTNPGDCNDFQNALKDTGIDIFYNPEFIAQGSIITDLQNADMVLIGGNGKHKIELEKIYEKIQMGFISPSIYFMSTKAAEVTKIAVNCFLTTKISYANMLGDVLRNAGCGDEIPTVLSAIGTDSRVGRKYLRYGFGYGGPCFPRDNRAFASFAKNVGLDYNLGYVTDAINNQHAKLLCDYYDQVNENLPFFFSYITYKKGTDILTESQQYRLCVDLLDRGRKVYIQNDTRVIPQIRSELIDKYGDRVKIVDNKENITEKIFIIEL